MDTQVLFVCTGNICRSPAAEGIFKHLLKQTGLLGRMQVDSAGTDAYHVGEKADSRMREAASNRGYRLDSISRQFRTVDFERFEWIIAMDEGHYRYMRKLARSIEEMNKIKRMTDFCQRHQIDHVPDPYYGGSRGFEDVLDILEDACEGLLNSIKNNTEE